VACFELTGTGPDSTEFGGSPRWPLRIFSGSSLVRHYCRVEAKDASGIRIAAWGRDLPGRRGGTTFANQPVDVREWVSKLSARGLCASRIRHAYHPFGSIMRAAVESGYIARSPCVGVKLPRMAQREMLFLSAKQVSHLAGEIAEPYGVLVLTLAHGGDPLGGGRRAPAVQVRSAPLEA